MVLKGAQYKLIAPYVSSLPSHETTVNINTAPAFSLATLDDRLDVNAAQQGFEQKQPNLNISKISMICMGQWSHLHR